MSFDQKVVEAAMAGHAPAIHSLLSTSRRDLNRYARRHCRSADIEDAVQDTLWVISARVSALKSASAFAAWSLSIVRRICYRLTRDQGHLVGPALPETSQPPMQEIRSAISQAVARLPDTYRQVLILRDVFGYSAEESANELGLNLEAAKSRAHRARQLLRHDLGRN